MHNRPGSAKLSPTTAVVRMAILAAAAAACASVMGACDLGPRPPQPPAASGPSAISVTKVDWSQETVSDDPTDDYPLPNCGGSAALKQSLGLAATVKQSATVEDRMEGGGAIGLSTGVKAELNVAIEEKYADTFESASESVTNISMEAAPGTHVIYRIAWNVREYASVVDFELDGSSYSAPYTYRLQTPKIVGSDKVPCSGDTAGAPSPAAADPVAPAPAAPAASSVLVTLVTGSTGTLETPTLRLFKPEAMVAGEYPLDHPGGFLPYSTTVIELPVPWNLCEVTGFDIRLNGWDTDWSIEEVYLEIDGVMLFFDRAVDGGQPNGSWDGREAWRGICP